MSEKPRVHVSTVVIGENGRMLFKRGKTSYRASFGALLDLNPAETVVESLPPGEPTRLAFTRIGAALRGSLIKARVRYTD